MPSCRTAPSSTCSLPQRPMTRFVIYRKKLRWPCRPKSQILDRSLTCGTSDTQASVLLGRQREVTLRVINLAQRHSILHLPSMSNLMCVMSTLAGTTLNCEMLPHRLGQTRKNERNLSIDRTTLRDPPGTPGCFQRALCKPMIAEQQGHNGVKEQLTGYIISATPRDVPL